METTLDPSFNAAINFFLPAFLGALAILFAEAKKYIGTPVWDTETFIKSNMVPLALNIAVSVAVYFILVYVPSLKILLDALADSPLTEITAAGIFGFSQSVIKNIMKPSESLDSVEVVDEEEV